MMDRLDLERPGARYLGGARTAFEVWAPLWPRVTLEVEGQGSWLLEPAVRGYWQLEAPVPPGSRYWYAHPDGHRCPDPASLAQPDGVHGPSMVVDTTFEWSDKDWEGLELANHVFYELHTGTFTHEGTFEAIIPRLDGLRDLGITAIELMPVSQFPGMRNWGYDGTYPYAAQESYGGLAGLQHLADACHARGLALFLDVVYNHLGPEGNYAPAFGPYFTDAYVTPWGAALNFDGPGSDEVRRFFIASALFWIREAHVDGLRLDAIHAILDGRAALPFLEELAAAVHEEATRLGRRVHLVGETSRNDPGYVEPRDRGGIGLDAQWNEDFHHSLHALLTGEQQGYYVDYGSTGDLADCIADGYSLQGNWSDYYGRRHGRPSTHLAPGQLVVFSQNHDQVGNRARSDRLSNTLTGGQLRLAAAAVALSPNLPLFFMGEEYGETAPFWYFVDHGDETLRQAVREGRMGEFAAFAFESPPADPSALETFEASRLQTELADSEAGLRMRSYYRELLRLRRETAALQEPSRETVCVEQPGDGVLVVYRLHNDRGAALVLNFGGEASCEVEMSGATGWEVLLDSDSNRWEQSAIPATMMKEGPAALVTVHAPSAVLLRSKVIA